MFVWTGSKAKNFEHEFDQNVVPEGGPGRNDWPVRSLEGRRGRRDRPVRSVEGRLGQKDRPGTPSETKRVTEARPQGISFGGLG